MTRVTINRDEHTVVFRGEEDPPVHASNDSPDLSRGLRSIIGSGTIVHPNSNHSGRIIVIPKDHLPAGEVIIEPGDAAIIEVGDKLTTHVAIRARDCGQILGFSNNGWIFGIHSSNQTEFGFRPDLCFPGPITQRVFDYLRGLGIQPTDCQVYLGPSLGGHASAGCGCYEYTEIINQQEDASRLIKQICRCYPNLDLEGTISRRIDADKIYFHWGEIMHRILLSIGFSPKSINLDHNYCTGCKEGWWSDRWLRQNQPDSQPRPNNLSWISRWIFHYC